MANIRIVEKTEANLINDIVDIHMQTFTGFFLTFMGRGFLRQMYRSYCEYAPADLLVALDDQNRAVGFLAYSCDMSGLYKYMIKKKLIPFAWYSLGAFLRKPGVFLRIVRAFLKPGESKREEQYVELASIGVHPDAKQTGIGSQLIGYLQDIVDFNKYAYIALETDAVDNDGANRFYQKNGFVLSETYTTREGRKMNGYRYTRSSQK